MPRKIKIFPLNVSWACPEIVYSLKNFMDGNSKRISTDLYRLGVRKGEHLLIHSSLNSFGRFPDRAETIVKAFLDYLGDEGTLLMPSLSYKTVNKTQPLFNELTTVSCVGGLTEFFRTYPGVKRSIHPTHSVCGLGAKADFLLKDHLKDETPCGPYSPFAKLPLIKGKVMFLGCGTRPNTSMHAVEEKFIPSYLFGEKVDHELQLSSGKTLKKTYQRHGFKGYEQRYDRLFNVLDLGDYRTGKVLEAKSVVMDAMAIWEKGIQYLQQDPFYFVDRTN